MSCGDQDPSDDEPGLATSDEKIWNYCQSGGAWRDAGCYNAAEFEPEPIAVRRCEPMSAAGNDFRHGGSSLLFCQISGDLQPIDSHVNSSFLDCFDLRRLDVRP